MLAYYPGWLMSGDARDRFSYAESLITLTAEVLAGQVVQTRIKLGK